MDSTSTTPSTARIALKYGLLTGLALIILYMIMNISGMAFSENKPIGLLNSLLNFLIIPCVSIVLAMKYFKSRNAGYMTYGQGLSLGSLTGGVAGAISATFTSLYMTLIDPDSLQRVLEIQRHALEDQNLDDEKIDMAMGLTEKAMSPSISIPVTILSLVFMCFIYSLVLSAIMKKEQSELQV